MVSSIFELAAKALGHDTSTTVGAENARHDHRVHDLAERYQDEVNAEAHRLTVEEAWA